MTKQTPPVMLIAGTYKHPHKGFWSHYIYDKDGVKKIYFRCEHVTSKELFAYIKYEEARIEYDIKQSLYEEARNECRH